ncbi:hypothetical protein [Flavobacterium laiguense]|nr:hypothetical protein [Flavobacterium laiguense]
MDKPTAKLYDSLLKEIAKTPNSPWHVSQIFKNAELVGFTTAIQIETAITLFQEDGLIDFIKHPKSPEHNFGIYSITGKGVKFITFEGGYTEKRLYENYDKVNKRFTVVRHWVWFYSFLISFIANISFIVAFQLGYIEYTPILKEIMDKIGLSS